MSASLWKILYQVGYLGIFAVLIAWYGWLAPSTHFHVGLILVFLLVPLLFPLRGLLTAKRYTIGWSLFLCLAYFTHGIVEGYAIAEARYLGIIEVACSLMWFIGGMGYIRKTKTVPTTPPAPTSQTE